MLWFFQGPAPFLQRMGSWCPVRQKIRSVSSCSPITPQWIAQRFDSLSSFLRPRNSYFGASLPCKVKDGIQPDLHRGHLGSALVSLCGHLLRGVLHALLAVGVTAGQARVLRHFPEVLLSRARCESADDGDGWGVRALRLFPGHSQRRVEDLHRRDRPGLWPAAPRGAHRPHGLLRVGAHLPDGGKSGRRNSVSGR